MELGVPGKDVVTGKFEVYKIVSYKTDQTDLPHSPGALQRFDVYVDVEVRTSGVGSHMQQQLYVVTGHYDAQGDRFYPSSIQYFQRRALDDHPVRPHYEGLSKFIPQSVSGGQATLVLRAIQESGKPREVYDEEEAALHLRADEPSPDSRS